MIKALLRKRNEGFTLVELMIVVAIIGVLAALAIYGVSRYLKHSKTAEATRSIGAIENGSKNKFQLETETSPGSGTFIHVFCADAPLTPTTVPPGQKVKVNTTGVVGYNAGGWPCLKFTMNEPQFYGYTYSGGYTDPLSPPAGAAGTDARYTAAANGDLDGNTVMSTFQLEGQGGATGDAQRTKFQIDNEDE